MAGTPATGTATPPHAVPAAGVPPPARPAPCAIADRQGLDLAAQLQNRFGVQEPEELSITEASGLIDELKSSANGHSNGR